MTVNELLHRMSAREFNEWSVFYEQYPFGELRADMRAGMVASPILNAVLGTAGVKSSSKPSDWILDIIRKPVRQSWQAMRDLVKQFAEESASKKPKIVMRRRDE